MQATYLSSSSGWRALDFPIVLIKVENISINFFSSQHLDEKNMKVRRGIACNGNTTVYTGSSEIH